MKKTLVAGALGVYAALLSILAIGCRCEPTGHAQEAADITYDFPSAPLFQIVEIYSQLVKKAAPMPQGGWPDVETIHLVTPHPLTATEAAHLLENALKQQGHVTIGHNANGSLLAVVDPSYKGPRVSEYVGSTLVRMPFIRPHPATNQLTTPAK